MIALNWRAHLACLFDVQSDRLPVMEAFHRAQRDLDAVCQAALTRLHDDTAAHRLPTAFGDELAMVVQKWRQKHLLHLVFGEGDSGGLGGPRQHRFASLEALKSADSVLSTAVAAGTSVDGELQPEGPSPVAYKLPLSLESLVSKIESPPESES